MEENEKLRKDIVNRLKRIEGQVKGVQGMMEKNVCCDDILVQVAAIRSAMNKVGGLLIENYANNCLCFENEVEREKVKKLVKTINMFVK
ncbi:MAG: metal-sensitive transcriptional regulator [Clostridium sp.]